MPLQLSTGPDLPDGKQAGLIADCFVMVVSGFPYIVFVLVTMCFDRSGLRFGVLESPSRAFGVARP